MTRFRTKAVPSVTPLVLLWVESTSNGKLTPLSSIYSFVYFQISIALYFVLFLPTYSYLTVPALQKSLPPSRHHSPCRMSPQSSHFRGPSWSTAVWSCRPTGLSDVAASPPIHTIQYSSSRSHGPPPPEFNLINLQGRHQGYFPLRSDLIPHPIHHPWPI